MNKLLTTSADFFVHCIDSRNSGIGPTKGEKYYHTESMHRLIKMFAVSTLEMISCVIIKQIPSTTNIEVP